MEYDFFLHSHCEWEDIGFMWKMTFEIFIKSLRFETPWVIIGLNWALTYFIGAQKVKTSLLSSHIRQNFVIKSIFCVFEKIKNCNICLLNEN